MKQWKMEFCILLLSSNALDMWTQDQQFNPGIILQKELHY